MQTTSTSDLNSPNIEIAIRRFSVNEYHRLAEVGILGEDDRVELLEGLISPKMVHSPIHDATVSIVESLLRRLLLRGYLIRIQSAVTFQNSEPEPDFTVVHGDPVRYLDKHPGGPDIVHVIEVAESSINRDRLKATTYAVAGVPVYWIINLKDACIDTFENPVGGAYQIEQRLIASDELTLPNCYQSTDAVQVNQLFPPVK